MLTKAQVTSQLVRDINSTLKMQREVYLFITERDKFKIEQARSCYGQLQVKLSGLWTKVYDTDVIK